LVGRPLFQSPTVNGRGTRLEDDGVVGQQAEQDKRTAGVIPMYPNLQALQAKVYVRTTMIATQERPT
jgi:hypothetical protein